MYLVIDNHTGAVVSRTTTVTKAQALADRLTEANEWVFGHTFSYKLVLA